MVNMIATGIYAFLILFAVAVLYAARINYRRTRQKSYFMLMCIFVIGWLASDIAILYVYSPGLNVYIWNLGAVFAAFITPLFMLSLWHFANSEQKLPKNIIRMLFIIPSLTALLALTSPLHSLMRNVESLTVWPRSVVYTTGAWFLVHTAYTGTVLIITAVIVIRGVIRQKGFAASTVGLLLAAIIMMPLGTIVNLFGILPVDINPASMTATVTIVLTHLILSDRKYSVLFRLFNTLKGRVTFPVLMALFLMISIISTYVSRSTRFRMEDIAREQLVVANKSVQAHLATYERQTVVAVSALGSDAELIRLIREGDRQAIWQYSYKMKQHFNVDEIIVSSADGITLARSHLPESYGDDISRVPSMAAALNRELRTLYTPTPTASMVMTSTSPILDGDTLVGGVVVNFVIGNDTFLDSLSELFHMDATVFNSDGESVSSTLIHPISGERAVRSVAREDIIEKVIKQGQHLDIDLYVFGHLPYYAHYFPLPGADDLPNGMFFVGISQADSVGATNTQLRTLILIALSCATIISIITYLLVSAALVSLDGLAKNVKNVAAGKINMNIDRDKITTDEIGLLTQDICGLVDLIKGLVDDLSRAHDEYLVTGNMNYTVDISKYENSFAEVVGLINRILEKTTTNISGLTGVLGQIRDGDFESSVFIDAWPGEWKVVPQAIQDFTASLQSVTSGISDMIESIAAKGDLSFHINTSEHRGDWHKIMEGLNSIARAVDAPIIEIRKSIGVLNQGRFNPPRITGDYAGDFLFIKNDWNEYVGILPLYMKEISECLGEIAAGDLTCTITKELGGDYDGIKQSVNNISSSLYKTISDISVAAEQVLTGASQISTSASELAGGAQEQASAVQELNATIDTINQQTQENANSASEANELSVKSTANAQEGNEAMKQMLIAMEEIKESSNDISKIIKTIEDIAFQTNLLALNASVEAARAGEQGKGFAVVAEEVRNLAGRSQESANETSGLIATSISRVESGSDIAEATSVSLDTIVKNAGEVSEIIDNIASASKEQAEAIMQISQGLEQISRVTQSNSASSEETAAASQELNSQAEVLQQLVAYFRL